MRKIQRVGPLARRYTAKPIPPTHPMGFPKGLLLCAGAESRLLDRLQIGIVADDSFTAATDGISLFVGEGFFSSLSPADQLFVVRHELRHILSLHILRQGSRDPHRWNVACDMAINTEEVLKGVKPPKMALLLPPELMRNPLPSPERIYDLLKGDEKDVLGEDLLQESDLTPEERVIVASNVASARAYTNGNREFVRGIMLADEILRQHSKLPWKRILCQILTGWVRADYSWTHPSERFLARGVYLPSHRTQAINRLVVAVDVSHSMNTETVERIFADLDALRKAVQIRTLEVWTFNHSIVGMQTFLLHQPFKPKRPRPEGGTDFDSIFREVEKGPLPDGVVILTDGEADTPETTFPRSKIFWIIYDTKRVHPLGRTFFAGAPHEIPL